MCGICGFFQLSPEADKTILEKMNNRIIHRGPDDDGYYYTGPIGLAARRLSIIDLSTGRQPLASASGSCWIAYNGETYNFPALRKDLEARGVTFRTKTDTEVIVNLYELEGESFVNKLRGMFAFAIYDNRKNALILARDHVGKKPLYYYIHPSTGNLVFGSELKCILEYPGVNRTIDPEALDLFLTLEYIPAPFSIFSHVRKLPAGHILTFQNGQISIRRYWDATDSLNSHCGDRSKPNFFQLKEEFHALLKESTEMRMISDVPLGAFLSGGIDSSSIVAVMSGLSNQKVKTFSIGFEEKSYSELPYSQIVADRFQTEHHTRTLAPDIRQLVLSLSDLIDEPLADFSNFPTYLVSKTAREHVTVALSGDGGDEIFGGYEHYIAQNVARPLDIAPLRFLHPLLAKTTGLFPPSELKKGFVNRIKRFSEGLENHPGDRHFRWMLFLSRKQKKQLYAPAFLSGNFLAPLHRRAPFDTHFENSSRFEGLNRDLYLDFKTYMAEDILSKVDRMSMAASLEARAPLLDYKMVEFAFSLPPHFKVRNGVTKWFFKKAMEGVLPDEIIYRRKEGFSIPIKNWLKTELKELMHDCLSEQRMKEAGFFNHQFIQHMMKEHHDGVQNHAHRLWPLVVFSLWRQRFA